MPPESEPRVADLRSWGLRVALFVLPALPAWAFLAIHATQMVVGIVVVALSPIVVLPHVWRRRPRALARLELGQVMLCWVGPLILMLYWLRVFPEAALVAIPAAVAVVPVIRERPILAGALLVLTGAGVLRLGYDAPGFWLVLYAAAVAIAMAGVVDLWRRRALGLPRPLVWGMLGLQITTYALSMLVYLSDERHRVQAIASEGLVTPLLDAPLSEALAEHPLHQVTMYVASGERALIFFRHEHAALRVEPHREPTGEQRTIAELVPTTGIITNNFVYDDTGEGFYFVAGYELYRGRMADLSFQELSSFAGPTLSRHLAAAFIRVHRGPHATRVMHVVDLVPKVILQDVASRVHREMPLPYDVVDAIWHPDGDRIAVYGFDDLFGGHLMVVDLEGRILRHRVFVPFDHIRLAGSSSDREHFFGMYFYGGKVERMRWDDLESEWSAPIQTPRAAMQSGACLVVSSYAGGELEVYDVEDGRALTSITIGRRVRFINPSPDGDVFWVSSAAGQFRLATGALPSECTAGSSGARAPIPD